MWYPHWRPCRPFRGFRVKGSSKGLCRPPPAVLPRSLGKLRMTVTMQAESKKTTALEPSSAKQSSAG